MPHTGSGKKRMRQTEKRRSHNRQVMKSIKTQIKKLHDLAAKGPSEQALAEFKITVKRLDKAAARRVIHPNQAARRKSQLARLLQTKPARA
jgi:small subunit ribosomal protein S20